MKLLSVSRNEQHYWKGVSVPVRGNGRETNRWGLTQLRNEVSVPVRGNGRETSYNQ